MCSTKIYIYMYIYLIKKYHDPRARIERATRKIVEVQERSVESSKEILEDNRGNISSFVCEGFRRAPMTSYVTVGQGQGKRDCTRLRAITWRCSSSSPSDYRSRSRWCSQWSAGWNRRCRDRNWRWTRPALGCHSRSRLASRRICAGSAPVSSSDPTGISRKQRTRVCWSCRCWCRRPWSKSATAAAAGRRPGQALSLLSGKHVNPMCYFPIKPCADFSIDAITTFPPLHLNPTFYLYAHWYYN